MNPPGGLQGGVHSSRCLGSSRPRAASPCRSGFEPSGAYSVNGLDVSIDEIFRLFGQFGDGSQNIISISVE